MTGITAELTKPLTTKQLEKYVGTGVVEMGILNNAPAYPVDGTSIHMVANLNEYGGDNDRPPARHWLFKAGRSVEKPFREKLVKILRKKDDSRLSLLHELARETVETMKANIEANSIGLLPNADSTKRQKGGDDPMIDGKHLLRSIDYRVSK